MTFFKDNFVKKTLAFTSCFILLSCSVRAPQSFTPKQKKQIVEKDLNTIKQIKQDNNNYRKDTKIDLYTAIALAIKNNKNLKVKVLETALSDQQRENVKYDMLPGMAANAGYSGMDKYEATTSSTVTGDSAAAKGSTYSTSREKSVNDQRIGFSWNALDFGLSYIRAGQQGDRYLISQELERKAAHNITREVIKAYWNTYFAQQLLKEYDPLLKEVKKALNDSDKIQELLLQKPMDALRYQKELLDIQRALQTQKQVLMNSKVELGSLLGLLPNEKFTVVKTSRPLTNLKMEMNNMEEFALMNRPEMNEKHYQERISVEDTKANMRSLLPGATFTANFTNSSNTYLKNSSNFDYGTQFGGNLLNVFKAPTMKKISETNTEVIREQRLAVAMTVLSQVHLAKIDYMMAVEELETAQKYLEVSQKITDQVRNAQKIARFGQLELIREQASLLVAKLRRSLAYAQMQHSIGTMYSSLGIDVTKDSSAKHGKKLSQDITLQQHASMIQGNFMERSEQYRAIVQNPIQDQNPVVKNARFSFSDNTFDLQGDSQRRYQAKLENDEPLPNWLVFLPSQKTFYVRKDIKGNIEDIKVKVIASNLFSEAEDKFTLLVDPELRAERIANEKALAKKQEEEKLAQIKAAEEQKQLTDEKLAKTEENSDPKIEATIREFEVDSPLGRMKTYIDQGNPENKETNVPELNKPDVQTIETETPVIQSNPVEIPETNTQEPVSSIEVPGLRDDLSGETYTIQEVVEDEQIEQEVKEVKKELPKLSSVEKIRFDVRNKPQIQTPKNPYTQYVKIKEEEYQNDRIDIEVQRNLILDKDGNIEIIEREEQKEKVDENFVEKKYDQNVQNIKTINYDTKKFNHHHVNHHMKVNYETSIIKASLNPQTPSMNELKKISEMKNKLQDIHTYINIEKSNDTFSESKLDDHLASHGMSRYVQLASYDNKQDANRFKKIFSSDVGGLSVKKDPYSADPLYNVVVGPLDNNGVTIVSNNLNNLNINRFIITIY